MKGRSAASSLLAVLAALALAALTLYAYRELPARPFAADDYQWLLNVRGLSLGEVVRKAFDAGAQSHFYRPLVWLLFWAQTRVFGLDPRGFHAVSLGLHLLDAGLLGWLAWRLVTKRRDRRQGDKETRRQGDEEMKRQGDEVQSPISNLQSPIFIALLTAGFVALHPAPFEAVAWISAQSELLAAALLLLALHLWRLPEQRTKNKEQSPEPRISLSPRVLVSTLALGLALLAKESAVIGLPLLMLVGRELKSDDGRWQSKIQNRVPRRGESKIQNTPYVLPTLLTLAYVALQISIERRNYLLREGGYGLGPQVVLNPLRSLALIAAPLPGTEHADAAWLAPVGAILALALLALFALGSWGARRLLVALALTLLPTAPFASPPDSRYLYLPVMASALIVAHALQRIKSHLDHRSSTTAKVRASIAFPSPSRSSRSSRLEYLAGAQVGSQLRSKKWLLTTGSRFLVLGSVLLAWWAAGELHARERRFAAASGPGGSLWRVASAVCAEGRPERMVIVEPPLAAPHAEAIVGLACGPDVRAAIVGRDQVEGAIEGRSVVIAFPNGSAEVQRRT